MKHTVKVVIALILLTSAIIFASLFAQSYLSKTSINYEEGVSEIEKGIRAGTWENVGSILDQTSDKWEKDKKLWAVLIDHAEIDNIDETLSRMREYIYARESSSALAEASALKLYFRHIPAKENLSIENIL